MSTRTFTFAAAVNSRSVLEENLLASPCLAEGRAHQVLLQEGFASAAAAYNEAIDKSENDLIVFVHQDMILPGDWLGQIESALVYLEEKDPNWGVLGCYGKTQANEGHGYVFQSGPGFIGAPFELPERVQTLDEIVLILRKSSGLRFDESLSHYHLYGTDICLRAEQSGRRNYSVPAFCVHNTNQNYILPKEFYECYWQMRRVWKNKLPIQASCIRITKWNVPVYKRRLWEIYLRYLRQKKAPGMRSHNVQQLLKAAGVSLPQSRASESAPLVAHSTHAND